MTIEEIAYALNDLASEAKHAFSSLQEIRAKHGIKPRTWSPFAASSIKDHYAFHSGGRKEFQFNVGEDELDGETIFRYGLAFSLNEDRTLHNSKAEFKSKIEGFNKFLSGNSEFFRGYKMWYYSDGDFVDYFDRVQIIDNRMFQAENFIFIGLYFRKKATEISKGDLEIILKTFDYLLPVYETVQFGQEESEKRIARVCWNDKGWVMPSGRHGKSRHGDSHEARYGYGHEEWLFDTGKLIDGYHYGFLEPIRKQQEAFSNNVYDVWLFAINGETKKRYWVGKIGNAEVLDKVQAERVKEEYIKRNWLQEMEEQIRASGANPEGFSNWKGLDLFNIRTSPSKLKLNDPYIEIPNDHPVSKHSRYSFASFRDEFKLPNEDEDEDGFTFTSSIDDGGDGDGRPTIKGHLIEPRIVEIAYLHRTISRRLTKELRRRFGANNVTPEHKAGYGANRIDIVVKDRNELSFYEIKTYPTLRTSIREAIGQLMEYSLWPTHKKASRLIVVTQPHEDFDKAKTYFKHLRETYNLPLFYQSYDIERNILSELA